MLRPPYIDVVEPGLPPYRIFVRYANEDVIDVRVPLPAARCASGGLRLATRATLEEIRERYAEWETIGEPEVRVVDPNAGYFNPYRKPGE
jgi:hypothetical protein